MRDTDVAFAVELTALEEWGYAPADFARFMAMDPEGALVAWEGSDRVGLAIVTLYGEIAWIGSIIVSPEARGKGVGHALVAQALRYVEDHDGNTLWLNAYTHTEGFYVGLGFTPAGGTVHLDGQAAGHLHEDVRLVHTRELPRIVAFDQRFFGANRAKVLEAFYHEFGESFFLWDGGGGQGYAVGTPYPGGVEVAPCVAETPDVTRALLEHLLAHFPGASVGLNVPEENQPALGLVQDLGFEEAFRTVRMYWGKGAGTLDPSGIVSLGGLEKG